MTDREKLIRLLKNAGVSFEYRPAEEVAEELIANGVNLAPVVHSEWEITDVEHAYGTKCYHCPECGEDEWRYDAPNYCPNCGAKMDGAKDG